MPAKPAATDVSRTRAKARDKSATRASILDAGRRLAADVGTDAVTLAGVAAEAGFARATVYGYFKSKDELLAAIAAKDLEAIADAMGGEGEWPASLPTVVAVEPETAAEEASVEQEAARFFDLLPVEQEPVEQAPIAQEPSDPFAALAADPLPSPTPAPRLLPRKKLVAPSDSNRAALEMLDSFQLRGEQKAELNGILDKLAPSDPPNSEGSAAALMRYDRRLRVVERTVTDLQNQQERADRSTTHSADFLSESLRNINLRLEESERRQRETFAELRAGAREAARRLDSLEGGQPRSFAPERDEEPATAIVPDVEAAAPAMDMPVPADAETQLAAPVAHGAADPAGDGDAENAETKAARVTYLTAARNSARIAAEEKATVPKPPKPWFYRIPRKYLMFTCAIMSVVVLVIGVLVVQRASAIAARADTITAEVAQRAKAHMAAMPVAPKRIAAVTPLDELSAMASQGDAKAQLIVGLKYLKGTDGIEKNPVEAAKWVARAAQRGEPMAQYWAGYIYQHGIGVSADPDAALRWYEAAADQGNTKAMYNLGVGYAQGWNGAKDAPEASRWFARAARLGFVDAQFNLAVLYERGLGVPPNMSDAYKWYAVAAHSGDAESKKRMNAIASQMDADDLAAAQR
ncbi:MAG TPA: TetR family transcriptional regulator, partial [Rhizomicrobium sp.]|nr:TetR family transcriptional regulator [Rhizomicrobium sp.]